MSETIDSKIICSWTNGRKATVHLVEQKNGQKMIVKRYKKIFSLTMLREYFFTKYLSKNLNVMPKVLNFKPWRKEIVLTYIPGDRVLEWVLLRCGDKDIQLKDFHSFHHLDTNDKISRAFQSFRESQEAEILRLKQAIKISYEKLHKSKFVHGSADPRNIIYDGENVFIIDFDHSRPSLNPSLIDYRKLTKWYGISI